MKSSRAAKGKKARPLPKRTKQEQNWVSLLSSESQPIAIFALVVIVFLCYANSLGNDFVFDDIYLVMNNQHLRSFDLNFLATTYRPLRDVSYVLDFALWGEGPFGFHVTNMLLHAANVVLVFALIRRLTADFSVAILAALIFAVHPIQTDAVTYISGRRDLLFCFFYLLAFFAYLHYYRTRWSVRSALYFILFLVLWGLSLLSKEMAVSLPILIFVWHYCDAWEEEPVWWQSVIKTLKETLARDKWFWLILLLSGLGFTAAWVFVKGASRRAGLGKLEYWGGSFYLNFLTVIRVHAWYLKQLVFPTPIAQYLGAFEISQSAFDWSFVLSLILVGGLLGAAFFLLNRNRLAAFGILSYFVTLLPVSQIIPHHELLADHYLYLPMMSFGLVVALLVRKIASTGKAARKIVYTAAGVGILTLGIMTVRQNRTWKNEYTLWAANYKAVPSSSRAALNLGNTYQDTEPARAEELFKRALDLNPTPEIKRTVYDRLAVILIQQKRFDEAEFYVAEVLSNAPNDFFGNLWASEIHMFKKECVRARAELTKAASVAVKPRELSLAQQARQELEKSCGN